MNILKRNLWLIITWAFIMWVFLLPNSVVEKIPSLWIKDILQAENFHLWLDLKWWSHLDYRIDLRKAYDYNNDDNPENDVNISEVIQWVQATIEKRVNWLWVSEPNIYLSKAADEHHIIVELAGIQDIEEAKKIVWKTIQLEFKELKNIWSEEEDISKAKKIAEETLAKISWWENFEEIWEKTKSSDWKIVFSEKEKTKQNLPIWLENIFENEWFISEIKEITDWTINNEWYDILNKWFSIIKIISKTENSIKYKEIFFSTVPSRWKNTGLDGSNFKRANVQVLPWSVVVNIEFDSEWWKLFWEITEKNKWKPIAIFVWWQLVSAPNVNEAILWWSAQITWNFTLKEWVNLKNDLNTWAIWAPIILSGQHNVDAMLWKESLEKSLKAWIWGLLILIIYMIIQYRFLWLVSGLALILYSIILLFILKTSWAVWIPIVMTLAWIAWIILSIWMAVDANILIFERTKEEIADWKNIIVSVSVWFDRAWNSIKDSNISSLITCAILIWFWTSMIRWFAINLAIWILISMFTAITFTRSFLMVFLSKVDISNKNLWGRLKK